MFRFATKIGFAAAIAMLLNTLVLHLPIAASDKEKTNTVMTVGEMCDGCVKKITRRFDGVEGIAKVTCIIEDKSVTVIPTQGVRLSPNGIWEIMDEIGKAPTKLISPDGTFTSKPSA